jgi:predicted nucleic acid-binding protein
VTTSGRVSTGDVSRNRPRQILLLDTCLLIDHLRGFDPARLWLTTTVAREDAQLACSVITVAELMSGLKTDGPERGAVEALLSLTKPVPVDEAIARHAAGYMRQWRQSHGLAMPDALIAATAREIGAALATRDGGHFPMTDIEVFAPY